MYSGIKDSDARSVRLFFYAYVTAFTIAFVAQIIMMAYNPEGGIVGLIMNLVIGATVILHT